jgi:uncharacterized protein
MDTLRNETFSPDMVWHQGGPNQTSGDYRGVDSVLGLLGKLAQLTDGTFSVALHDVLASDEHAVALAVCKGQRGGRQSRMASTATFAICATAKYPKPGS